MQIELHPPKVHRRDAPVVCPVCGRRVPRKARQQQFCSRRCRKRAHYAKSVAEGNFGAVPTQDTALGTNPQKNINGFNGLQGPKTGSSTPQKGLPAAIVEIEVFGGREWRPVVSSDGVPCEASTWRQRALRESQT